MLFKQSYLLNFFSYMDYGPFNNISLIFTYILSLGKQKWAKPGAPVASSKMQNMAF